MRTFSLHKHKPIKTMNYNPIDPAQESIRHYETHDAIIDRDYAAVGIRSRRKHTATKEEHDAFWKAVANRKPYVPAAPVSGDIIGYDKFCKPIYA